MKKKLYIIFVLIFTSSCCSSINRQNKAHIVYLYNLNIIYDYTFYENETWEDKKNREVDAAIDFLEKITNIKCDRTEDFAHLPEPSKKNYWAWKKWFEKNKKRLYWDKKERKVKLKQK